MLLLEIEKQVKPLSVREKQQLIRDVQRMVEEETLRRMVRSDVIYEIDTPNLTTDERELVSISEALQHLRKEYSYAF